MENNDYNKYKSRYIQDKFISRENRVIPTPRPADENRDTFIRRRKRRNGTLNFIWIFEILNFYRFKNLEF